MIIFSEMDHMNWTKTVSLQMGRTSQKLVVGRLKSKRENKNYAVEDWAMLNNTDSMKSFYKNRTWSKVELCLLVNC
jgi:hypothetical protein